MAKETTDRRQSGSGAGIALGPILFVIAVLAILASAAAMSGGYFRGGQ